MLKPADPFARHHGLYYGTNTSAVAFQLTVGGIDVAVILFFLAGHHLTQHGSSLVIDYVIAVLIACELAGRALVAHHAGRFFLRPVTIVDIVILATLLFPALFSNFGFLRALIIWSFSHSRVFGLLVSLSGVHR